MGDVKAGERVGDAPSILVAIEVIDCQPSQIHIVLLPATELRPARFTATISQMSERQGGPHSVQILKDGQPTGHCISRSYAIEIGQPGKPFEGCDFSPDMTFEELEALLGAYQYREDKGRC